MHTWISAKAPGAGEVLMEYVNTIAESLPCKWEYYWLQRCYIAHCTCHNRICGWPHHLSEFE